jgi:hypothetical protein
MRAREGARAWAARLLVAACAFLLAFSFSPEAFGRGSEFPKKFVLTWDGPVDLDLHLAGPASTSRDDRFHAWRGAGAVPGFVRFDGRAPGSESISITRQPPGVYQLYVHDFTDAGSTTSDSLSRSNARVAVYYGQSKVREVRVPPGEPGTLWTALWMYGDSVDTVGTMSFEQDPAKVGTTLLSALIPGDLLLGAMDDSLVPGRWSHAGIYVGGGRVAEAASEDTNAEVRTFADWQYPEMTWVKYLRVITADRSTRERAVSFALEQVAAGCPYDRWLPSKQLHGRSWYCSELVWAAYMNASNLRINLEHTPDFLGVYPWEIESDDDVAVVGGHFERAPKRSWRVVYLYGKLIVRESSAWLEGQLLASHFVPVGLLVILLCLDVTTASDIRRFRRKRRF